MTERVCKNCGEEVRCARRTKRGEFWAHVRRMTVWCPERKSVAEPKDE